ncbi:hypothetical protein [Acetobacter fabarum]
MVAEVESTLTAIKDSYGADEIIGTYTFFKEAIQDRSDVPSYARDYVAKQLESNNFIEQALSSYDEANSGNLRQGAIQKRKVFRHSFRICRINILPSFYWMIEALTCLANFQQEPTSILSFSL